jgi:hypothetical protein
MMHHLIYLARLIVVTLLVFAIVWYAQRNGSRAHRRGIAVAWAVIAATIAAAW